MKLSAEGVQAKIMELIAEKQETHKHPDITPLGKGCFSIPMSTIRKDKNLTLSPEYWDFAQQYKVILTKVQNVEPSLLSSALHVIIQNKLVKTTNYSQGLPYVVKTPVHPDVLTEIKKWVA